ncbi:uncharacterized protein LOC105697547 [Orussus abietinus]|uniref:uncharacterized protein LOC105697547 n=1 Tax=Orussus abietinus TaxID=222816 RepID=UPI000626771E|nr:uncharacterized protein LOC105697547 [Orussus abietinus]
MALTAKRFDLKHVPWFSLSEWHNVYKKIYSNDFSEQNEGYQFLLLWKARIARLPVGVDCTLAIMQACLRDRELTPKIDRNELPMYYGNDLCLMYSITIMRFMNHISNVGDTKQSNLFQIAKQLKIPDWIVNLRHDAAHGHELPSIDALRIAANFLLRWLHDEYWIIEAQIMKEQLLKQQETAEKEESEDIQDLADLIELWMAVGLYIEADYSLVIEVPDIDLRDTLHDLRTHTLSCHSDANAHNCKQQEFHNDETYELKTAQSMLLSEISRFLNKNTCILKKDEIILNILCESEAFLPTSNFISIFTRNQGLDDLKENRLPVKMLKFWENFITLLQERNMLQSLILKLIEIVNNSQEDKYKRRIASLWIRSIVQSVYKIIIARKIMQRLEHTVENKKRRISLESLSYKIQDKVNHTYPELKQSLWLKVTSEVPSCLLDMKFAKELIINANEFSVNFISQIIELILPTSSEKEKESLLRMTKIYMGDYDNQIYELNDKDKIYTVEDLIDLYETRDDVPSEIDKTESVSMRKNLIEVYDCTIRTNTWQLATGDSDWNACYIGILPWQINCIETLAPFTTSSKLEYVSTKSNIIPGMIDKNDLKMESNVKWDTVLRKKKKVKRKKQKGKADIMVDRALEVVKNCH